MGKFRTLVLVAVVALALVGVIASAAASPAAHAVKARKPAIKNGFYQTHIGGRGGASAVIELAACTSRREHCQIGCPKNSCAPTKYPYGLTVNVVAFCQPLSFGRVQHFAIPLGRSFSVKIKGPAPWSDLRTNKSGTGKMAGTVHVKVTHAGKTLQGTVNVKASSPDGSCNVSDSFTAPYKPFGNY